MLAAGGTATLKAKEISMVETASLPEVIEALNARIVAIRDSL